MEPQDEPDKPNTSILELARGSKPYPSTYKDFDSVSVKQKPNPSILEISKGSYLLPIYIKNLFRFTINFFINKYITYYINEFSKNENYFFGKYSIFQRLFL